MKLEDVIIVGGGPAGAFCAYELAKRGFSPIILDHSHPREKPCGGGISPPILQKFPFLESFRANGYTFGDFKIIACNEKQARSKTFKDGFCISRQFLDQEILKMATENGARWLKEKVTDVRQKENSWEIATDKSTLEARILVGADGVNSIVRRKTIGPISCENLAITLGYIANPIKKNCAAIKLIGNIPGYIWVFPGKGYSNIGIGSELKFGSMLKGFLDAFISSYCPNIKIASKYAAMVPSANDPKFFRLPCAGKNWILVGDAAGHVDPISGGGIRYALWGSQIAAKVIKANAFWSYDRRWRRAFGKTLVERCKRKEEFYDPLKSSVAITLGLSFDIYPF